MVKRASCLLFLTIPFLLSAQPNSKLKEVEAELIVLRQLYLDSAFNFNDYSNKAANDFSEQLNTALKGHPSIITYTFDHLKDKITISNTVDNKLRIYSWYHHLGGTWHDIRSIAQYNTDAGLQTQALHLGNEGATGGYTDASYYKIQHLPKNDIYIITGWGTHGAGHHHKIMRAFRIENNQLIELEAAFDGKKRLAVETPRGDDINLTFDEATKSITYDIYRMNHEIGFYENTHQKKTLFWNGEAFLPKP